MKEVWKDIDGYEGLYQVSNLGRIKSLSRTVINGGRVMKKRATIMNTSKNSTGYLQVNLCVNNIRKKLLVHRIVATAFINNPQNLPQVNHIDENKQNNRVDNLEWCDNVYNNNYGSHCENISRSNGKRVYCHELDMEFNSILSASKFTGIDQKTISNSCKHAKKQRSKYRWSFVGE